MSTPTNTAPIKTCTHCYPDGQPCGDVAVGRGLCQRHYAQDRRGTLGKAKEVDRNKEPKVIASFTIEPHTNAKLDEMAQKAGQSRSSVVEQLIDSAQH